MVAKHSRDPPLGPQSDKFPTRGDAQGRAWSFASCFGFHGSTHVSLDSTLPRPRAVSRSVPSAQYTGADIETTRFFDVSEPTHE